jgi:hypothetical protein
VTMVRLPPVLLAVATAAVLASSASAAAPRYVFVTGDCVAEPVLLADWAENHALLLVFADSPRVRLRALRGRPRLRLSLFWGADSERPTRPGDANQFGWFYPAHSGRPAVLDIARGPRRASARALAILARHGVPTRSSLCHG